MKAVNIQILDTDTKFYDSPDKGFDCLCSRCGKPITKDVPIRVWPEQVSANSKNKGEYRYHLKCALPGARTINSSFHSIDQDYDM